MAKPTTLQDKVAQNSKLVSGQNTEPVQKLASQQGLAATPLTAYGTSLIGGSPQQAKMAGTPAAKAGAVKVAAPSGESELEQAQAFTTATESKADIDKKREAAKLSTALGTFGDKVNQWVESAKQRIIGQTATAQVDVSDKVLAGLDAGKKAEAVDVLKKLATTTNPQEQQQLELQLNTIVGRDALGPLSATEKAELYQSAAGSLKAATTAGQEAVVGADRKLTLSDMTELGTTQAELATLLQMPEGDVGNLSVGQLQQKIAEVSQKQFGTTQAVQAGLSSGALSSADRAALRQYLRDVETTGVAGAEAAVASLANQIDKSQQVQFAGKSFSLEELFSSPGFTDLMQKAVTDYEAGTGPTLENLKKGEPAVYQWLVNNYTGVKKLVDQSVGATTTFGATQKANVEALAEIGQYQPQLAKDLGFDPKTLRAEAIDPTKLPGVFQAVASLPPEQRQGAAGVLAQLSTAAGPDQLKGLSADQVKALQPGVVGGPADTYLKAADAVKAAQNKTYIDDIVKDFSSGDESLAELNDTYKDDALAAALGLPTSNVAELDTAKNGKIDQNDAAGLKSKMTVSLPSLDKLAAGERPSTNLNSFKLQKPAYNETQGTFFNYVKNAMSDGFLSQEEADALPFDLNTLQSLVSNIPREGAYMKNSIQGAIDRKRKQQEEAAAAAEAEQIRARDAAERAAADAARAERERKREEEKRADTQADEALAALGGVVAPGAGGTIRGAVKTGKKIFGR